MFTRSTRNCIWATYRKLAAQSLRRLKWELSCPLVNNRCGGTPYKILCSQIWACSLVHPFTRYFLGHDYIHREETVHHVVALLSSKSMSPLLVSSGNKLSARYLRYLPPFHWGRGPLETDGNMSGTLKGQEPFTWHVSTRHISGTCVMPLTHFPYL